MTKNLRIPPTTKEIIFDYIDAIKADKNAAGKEVQLKPEFIMHFRNLLQSYNPDLNEEIVIGNPRYSDKDLQCFVHAANTKHDIYTKDLYYLESFYGAFLGAFMGAAIVAATSLTWGGIAENCCKVSKDNMKHVAAVMFAAGGALGAYIGLKMTHNGLEKEEFWHGAMQCYDDIPTLEISGALAE